MTVTVLPAEFTLVEYDAEDIAAAVASTAALTGFAGFDIRVEVDESTPLAKASAAVEGGVVVVRVDSGAVEDTRRPRRLSDLAVRTSVGRVLLRLHDRRSGIWDGAPADEQLSLAHLAAWDAYAVGRLGRLGVPVHRPRWLYNFRNRHGFTDIADHAFATLWEADRLGWVDLVRISDGARGASREDGS
jgi:hypothetical protein